MPIEDTRVFMPAETVAYRTIAGSAVLVNIQDNKMIRLNETGSRIWSLLDGRTVDEIAGQICDVFEVAREAALEDTREFLGDMVERGLVTRQEKG